MCDIYSLVLLTSCANRLVQGCSYTGRVARIRWRTHSRIGARIPEAYWGAGKRTGRSCWDRRWWPGLSQRTQGHSRRTEVCWFRSWYLFYCLIFVTSIEIEALKAELSEGKDQLRWLQERIQELDAQKREAKNTITTAERVLHRKKNSTRSEVFRLKGEYYWICQKKILVNPLC